MSHRDTEKTPGMFATLVLVLPSIFTGGALIVRHGDRQTRLDLQSEEPSEAAWAAFYADCLHEVAPVTSGCRLALIYNLSRGGRGPTPMPPAYGAEQDRLTARLRHWASRETIDEDESRPSKLIYLLEHAYTPEALGFDALKGVDAARAATLRGAARAAECDLNLALLSIEETGSAEYNGDYRRRWRGGDDEEDFEIIDVDERNETLTDWRGSDGGDPGLGPLPVEAEEVSPPGALEDMDPDEVSFQEATGNAGATFERRYRAAALVLWPARDRLAIVNQGGLLATLPHLTFLAEQWAAAGKDRLSPLWDQAHALAGHMLMTWRIDSWRSGEEPGEAARMLGLLTALGDADRIEDFLSHISAVGGHGPGDNGAVLAALPLLPPARRIQCLTDIMAGNGEVVGVLGRLMVLAAAAAARGELGLTAAELRPAAVALVASLPGDPDRIASMDRWGRKVSAEPGLVVDVLTACESIDPSLGLTATDLFLDRPDAYDPDAVLTPAAISLARSLSGSRATRRIREAAAAHLRARIARPLAPPGDWRRAATLNCRCELCSGLARFLDDPAQETWSLRAVQADRGHVESTIRNSRCDVNVATLRKGSPHSLICNKNQASYEHLARQRRKDLQDLATILADDVHS